VVPEIVPALTFTSTTLRLPVCNVQQQMRIRSTRCADTFERCNYVDATGVAEACQIDATSDATKGTPQKTMTQHSLQQNTQW
jgi:hypothetical protein